ncbi:MAG: hypothetical protein ABFS46_07405, partial [Myxococcota bacterium]
MSTIFLTRGRQISFALAMSDLLLLSLGLVGLALAYETAGTVGISSAQLAGFAGFIPLQLAALHAFGLQAPAEPFRIWSYGARLALALVLGLAGFGAVNQLCGVAIDPPLLAAHVSGLFCLLFAVRFIVLGWAIPRSPRRRLAVVGEVSAVLELAGRIQAEPFAGYSIVRVCIPPSQKPDSDHLDLAGESIEVTDEVGKLLGSGDFDAIAFDPHCNNFNDRDLCQLAEL